MHMHALERLGRDGREIKIRVVSYLTETPQLFTGHAYGMRMDRNSLLVDMRPWVAFYQNPSRVVNKESTDAYQGFRITDRDILTTGFRAHTIDMRENFKALRDTPELKEYLELAQCL